MNASLWQQPVILPRALREDGWVRVVHLAGASNPEDVRKGIEILQRRHHAITWDPGAASPSHYLAASDTQRIAEWTRAIQDPQVDAMICARGGYGTMRLLDHLPACVDATRVPWLVGYSDITALHLWLNAHGIATIHGPMVAGLHRYEADGENIPTDQLMQLLKSRQPPRFEGLRTIRPGRTVGRLIGGNLSMLQAMIGTPWLPTLNGAILLIEEIGEPAYRLDRMLQSLLLGNRACGLAGIVFGAFTRCNGIDSRSEHDWFTRWTSGLGCPIVMGLPVGHGDENSPLMLGVDVLLDATEGTLTPLMPADSLEDSKQQNPTLNVHRVHPQTPPLGAGYRGTHRVAPGPVVSLLTEMLDIGACSALQLVVSQRGEQTHALSMGSTCVLPDGHIQQVQPTTRFDLASVSKAMSTAILAHQLIEDGVWSLPDVLPDTLHPCGATLGELLSHRSGLPAWINRYDDARKQTHPDAWLRQQWHDLAVETPPNQQCVYSDIGYMLLGFWIEQRTGRTLDDLFEEKIATPLGLTQTGYQRLPRATADAHVYAATEWCPYRTQTLQGIVHDEHAQILHGVAGHAGLFSTAFDVDRIARSLLGYGPAIMAQDTVQRMWSKHPSWCEGGYTYGWDTPTVLPSNAGSFMPPHATVGHLGYTGTSVWIDTEHEIAITFLTNRVHPSRDSHWIRVFRPKVHDAVMGSLGYGP